MEAKVGRMGTHHEAVPVAMAAAALVEVVVAVGDWAMAAAVAWAPAKGRALMAAV